MTKLKLILVALILLAGCKTKEKSFQKEKEKITLELSQKIDSLVEVRFKERLKTASKFDFQASNFSLKTVPVFDSLGNRVPFHYKHYIDGNLKEEIFVQGGEVATDTKAETATETIQREHDVGLKSKVNVKKKAKQAFKKKAKRKAGNTKVKGFQAGVYNTWSIIILLLLLLWWFNRKFNLLGRLKTILVGGKKSPPAI